MNLGGRWGISNLCSICVAKVTLTLLYNIIINVEICYNHKSLEASHLAVKEYRKKAKEVFQRMSTASVCMTVMRISLEFEELPPNLANGVRENFAALDDF